MRAGLAAMTTPRADDDTPDTTTSQERSDQPDTTTTAASARRARLAAMAQPRPGDTARTAALRAMLRDEALMAQVTANVDAWPDPTEQQRQTIAALLHRPSAPPPGPQR